DGAEDGGAVAERHAQARVATAHRRSLLGRDGHDVEGVRHGRGKDGQHREPDENALRSHWLLPCADDSRRPRMMTTSGARPHVKRSSRPLALTGPAVERKASRMNAPTARNMMPSSTMEMYMSAYVPNCSVNDFCEARTSSSTVSLWPFR